MKTRLITSAIIASGIIASAQFFSRYVQPENILNTTAHAGGNVPEQTNSAPNYGSVPLHFEANDGQVDARVKFLSRGSGYSLFLTSNEAVLSLRKPAKNRTTGSDFLRLKFVGANISHAVTGEGLLEGKTNYLIGSDPGKWKKDVANFARVRYSNIYDGIDIVYYGGGSQLEYDLVVSPHADPRTIALKYSNAKRIKINDQGDLVVQMTGGTIRQHKPVAYQEINGERIQVAASYELRNRQVAFRIGDYDTSEPLIIDPVLSYSTYLGGGADTIGTSIAVDAAGSAYVTGYTDALDFPTVNPVQTVNSGGTAGFITKLNPAGTAFVYSTYIGGNSRTFPSSIKVDAAGSAYIGGWTLSSNYPTTAGSYRPTPPPGGGRPSFVTKLSPNGASLSYSTYLGAVNDLTGIALDASGNTYLTGYTQDAVFPTTPGAYKTTLGDGISQNAFVSKLNAAGSTLVYSTFVGTGVPVNGFQAIDQANAIAVDPSGNAYITGLTISRNYPVTSGAFQISPGGSRDAFVTKLNPSGTALVYSTYLGGLNDELGRGIAVDSSGNAYVTGNFEGTPNFPFTPNAFRNGAGERCCGQFNNSFLTKINSTGTALFYSTALGYGNATTAGSGVAVGSDGSAYAIGSEAGGMGVYGINAVQSVSRSNDSYILKINPAGTGLAYSTPLGGTGIRNQSTVGSAIAIDATGNAYVTGSTNASDFPVTSGAAQATKPGGDSSTAFVAKIGVQPNDCPPVEINPQPLPFAVYNQSYAQQLTANGGVAPYTFSLAPSFSNNVLPVGLTLSSGGTMSGTPSTQSYGTYLVTVQAIDAHGCFGVRTLQFDLVSRVPSNIGIHLKVVARPLIRIGNEYTSFITYTNSTPTDLVNVPIVIRVPTYVSLRMRYAQPARTFTQAGFNYISVILPRIKATGDGSIQTVPVVIKVPDPNRFGQEFSLEAAIPRDRRVAPAPGNTSLLSAPPTAGTFQSFFKVNDQARPSSDCNIFDPDSSCDPIIPPMDCLEAPEGCAALFNNSTALFLTPPPADVDYDSVRINPAAPSDPNDKSGPGGSGVQRYYTGDFALPYVVSFENVATATLPAQDVVVTDQLDPNVFDFSTFSFSLIAFGDKQVASPIGVKQFTSDIDLRPAKQAIVRVSGNFDSGTGLIKWQFHTLDPTTDQPPEDPQAGFLPPNRTSPEGQGTLFYTVKAKPGLPTGTQIKNKARIVFDVNPPIDTPEWLNTMDNTKPTSSVQALPTSEPLSFTLNWSGTDVGAGISTYTVYVSQDGGSFTPFLTNTTQTSIVVNTIQTNHTFRFYSIATDAAGNVEPAKTIADATTTIAPVVTVSGKVTTPDGRGLRSAVVTLIDSVGGLRTATTSSFGFYSFDNVATGAQYQLRVNSRLYRFAPKTVQVTDTLTNVDFVGLE